MASPQKENGYTAIANELLEALILAGLTGAELTIYLFILRKTYGYQKKQDSISISQFVENTIYSRRGIIDCLRTLQRRNIIICIKKGSRAGDSNIWKCNKDYDTWVGRSTALVKQTALGQNSVKPSAESRIKVVNQTAHTKEIKEIKEISANAEKTTNQFTIGTMPLSLEDLSDDTITYESIDTRKSTPKKYNRGKLMARLAVNYMQRKGEEGNVLRHYPVMKEIIDKSIDVLTKENLPVTEENITKCVLIRFDLAEEQFNGKWGLNAINNHFNRLTQ